MTKVPCRRSAIATTALLVGAAIGAVAFGQLASASTPTASQRISLAYTRSALPGKSFTNPVGDVPVGTSEFAGSVLDTSRIYATFDLSQYQGRRIMSATLFLGAARSEANCDDRALDVWQTQVPTDKISWQHAPAEISQIGSVAFSIGCPAVNMHADLTAAITEAVAAGDSEFAIELRAPASHEIDPQYALTLKGASVQLSVDSNATPSVPTSLTQDDLPCAIAQPYQFVREVRPTLLATVGDADNSDLLTTEFDVWPVDHAEQRTAITSLASRAADATARVVVPAGVLSDGGTYAWQARTSDGTDTSPWSQTCVFGVDTTPPANAPGVDSPNYPPGSDDLGGVPAIFDFTPNGVSDVAGYTYDFNGISAGGADAGADGSATVTLSPPISGEVTLSVRSFDRARNLSPTTTYSFFLRSTAPNVTTNPSRALLGKPFTLDLTPGPNTVEVDRYTITVNSTDVITVSADADGSATATLTAPAQPQFYELEVRSYSTNGWVSDATRLFYNIDTSPFVTSDIYPENGNGGGVGVPGTFTFTSLTGPVASFTYNINFGDDITVPVNSSGDSAQVTVTPDSSDANILSVYATNIDGSESDTYFYVFNVNG
jgi:hypothetical protein